MQALRTTKPRRTAKVRMEIHIFKWQHNLISIIANENNLTNAETMIRLLSGKKLKMVPAIGQKQMFPEPEKSGFQLYYDPNVFTLEKYIDEEKPISKEVRRILTEVMV